MAESDSWPGLVNGTERHVRGATTALNYVLLLVIVTLLVTGLLTGIGTFVGNQEERAVNSQLETVGNRLAADIRTANTLVNTASSSTTVRLRSQLPESVAGNQYRIEISDSGGGIYRMTLRSTKPEMRTSVVLRSEYPVVVPDGTVRGGRLIIEYDATNDRLEVRSDA